MKRFAPVVLVVVSLCLVAGASVATAADTSPCLGCHDVSVVGGSALKVDFAVPAVDYTKCKTCHRLSGTQGDHWHQSTPCRTCHYSWPPYDAPFSSPTYDAGDYGFFDGPDSLSASAEELHAIHTQGNWIDGGCDPTMQCENCHAPAACSACHGTEVAHDPHAESEYPAVSYRGATGTGFGITELTCVNDACHPATSGVPVPTCESCHGESADSHAAAHDDVSASSPGCSNCHLPDLVDEHVARGYGCVDCHMGDASTDVIASGSATCDSCHASPAHRQRPGRR